MHASDPHHRAEAHTLRRRIRILLWIFIIGLVLSGVTAFPIQTEITWLTRLLGAAPGDAPESHGLLLRWLLTVQEGVVQTNRAYPFLAYGTDWLAFAHLVIALLFIGPLRDPVRNEWVVAWGMMACVGVVPLALIAGSIREIPFWWRLVDCSFGVFGIIPLWIARRWIRRLALLDPRFLTSAG
ncbi:MAG TPA: hypothetical protein VF665_07810 [Longimicrobium sp.]|jgi:hypothetical protein|uniref:hypothetical protein n=1 Tax=Longimicrobium sp. TaxID=2029185 RepID=UPI002ED7C638